MLQTFSSPFQDSPRVGPALRGELSRRAQRPATDHPQVSGLRLPPTEVQLSTQETFLYCDMKLPIGNPRCPRPSDNQTPVSLNRSYLFLNTLYSMGYGPF